MWGQKQRGGGVLYPRQNAIETAGRELGGILAHRSLPLKCGCVGAAGVSEQLCLLCDCLLFQPTTDSG